MHVTSFEHMHVCTASFLQFALFIHPYTVFQCCIATLIICTAFFLHCSCTHISLLTFQLCSFYIFVSP
ncbi:hypothetical protein BC835DRAFT_1341179, partial [Cytidiella melzeri]